MAKNTVLLVDTMQAIAALPWAARIAGSVDTSLVLLCVGQGDANSLDEIPPDAEGASELIQQCTQAVAEQELEGIRLYECRGPNPRRAVLDALADLDVHQLILHELFAIQSPIKANLVRQMARAAPCDVLLLDAGGLAESPGRVLFTQLGGMGEFGLGYAIRTFLDENCPIVVIPDPMKISRSDRYYRKVHDNLPHDVVAQLQRPAPAESIDSALHEATLPGDLVLFDADNADRVSRLLAHLKRLRQDKPETEFAVGITRAAHAAGPGVMERALERLHLHVPQLDRDARRELFGNLERGGRFSVDFMIMLMVSAAIAALGLVQNSTAVVIGGMLVAPLMTPLLATGMALVQGNIVLFRSAAVAMLLGIAGALLCSMLVGLTSPWPDLSAQIVDRGSPNPFDLGIAFLSGVAAAYALARPGLAGTLVGVAVAVALVPPLASVGIAVVKMELAIAFGAAVLFTTNLIAIILGATLVFRFFGLDVSRRGKKSPPWVRITVLVLALALLPTVAVLIRNLQVQIQEGVHRPYARPLPAQLRDQVRRRVAAEPGASVVFMAHSDIEHGFGVEIVIALDGEPSESIKEEITSLVKAAMGEDIPVDITLVRALSPAASVRP